MDEGRFLILICLSVAVLAVHWQATKKDINAGLRRFARAFLAWLRADSCSTTDLNPMAARVEGELCRVRMSTFMLFARLCIHPTVVVVLMSAAEFAKEPSCCCGIWLLGTSASYIVYWFLLAGQLPLTPSLLGPLRFFMGVVSIISAVGSGYGSTDSFPGRIGILLGSQVLQAMLFPAGAATVALCMCHTAAYVWAAAQAYGQNALNLWLVVFHLAFQLLVCIGLPFLLEFTMRECITASFQSQDSNSLIAGFRQMLKGVCDGELLLDCNFEVCGSAPSLQRLLASKQDFAGCSFRELIDSAEAREKFDKFLAPRCQENNGGSSDGAPRCLRVPLKAGPGRLVSVDVFHVPLPSSLYGANATYHLLAMTEDVDCRAHPEADPNFRNALPSCLLADRRAPTERSEASTETQVEGWEELAEMTLLLNSDTELLDIEEAHLRFVRHTHEAEVRMGMPTLKRFARPLDWCGIETAMRRYTRQVRRAQAHGEAAQKQALPPLVFRALGESRKHLLSRSVTISSPFERKEANEPVFLFLHMTDFRAPPRAETPRRLAALNERASTLPAQAPQSAQPSSRPRRRSKRDRGPGDQISGLAAPDGRQDEVPA